MAKPTARITLSALALWAASLCWAASDNPAPLAALPVGGPSSDAPAVDEAVSPGKPQVTPAPGVVAPEASAAAASIKPLLGEVFIVQDHLQVYLNRPAAIYVYNARGQQVYHTDSHASLESIPLMGMNTGFLYLTVRSGQTELTKKLVYTGK